MQKDSKHIRHETMIAQAIRTKITLQFLVAVFTFATHRIVEIRLMRILCGIWYVCNHRTLTVAESSDFGLHHNRLRAIPVLAVILFERQKTQLRSLCFLLFGLRFRQMMFTQTLDLRVEFHADRVRDVRQRFECFIFLRTAECRICPNVNHRVRKSLT